tara:strand:+ start:40 stop:708 length:669 start_codon:yes stop_codon:yes gene_type:complete
MQKQKSKKILLYFFLFLSIGTLNNKNFIGKNFAEVNKISIKGLDEKNNFQIKKRISYLKLDNLFFVDKVQIGKIIQSNNLVESFTVFKIYPSTLDININKTNFLVRIKRKDKYYILGSNGKLIESNNDENIPFVFGDFKVKNFLRLKEAIDQTNFDFGNIKNLFSFKSGRWDIETRDGVKILLPKNKVKESLELFLLFSKENEKNDIKKFDLRQHNQVITNG